MKNERAILAIVGALIIGMFLGRYGLGGPEVNTRYEYTAESASAVKAMDLAIGGSPSMGAELAKVTIIESSDFQWPYCSKVGPTLKKLLETYPDDLKVVFKHNPLSFHKRALPVAKATMAAHMQGKFWEFHDLAFSQKRYDDATMDGYAKQLGLDMAQYRTDRDSEAVHAKILHDQASMVSNGARGTPAFFLNGKSMSGAKPYGAFKTEVDAALKEANAELAKGTALKDLHRVLATRNASAAFVDAVEDGKPARGGKARPAAKKPRDAAPAKAVKVNVAKVDPSMGEPKAAVTVVTFSDFQWPYCSKVGPTLKKLVKTYPKDVRVVFKQMPLGFHKDALPAAKASLAAGKQGKFWEYHDVLFANYKKLKRPNLESYAKDLGLNMKKFVKDMDSPEVAAQVSADMAEAKRIGVRGTPNSFVNGVPVKGARPFEGFKKVVDQELAKARGEKVPEAAGARGRGAERPKMGLLDEKKVAFNNRGAVVLGSRSAKEQIVVFVDLQDTFSGEVLTTLQKMQKKRKGLQLVVKHFPLGFHKLAQTAAQVAKVVQADAGNKKALAFMLESTRNAANLSKDLLQKLGTKAGGKESQVVAAISGGLHAGAVKADYKEARGNGAMATPTLFVNGRRYSGLKGYDAAAIGEALKASR